MGVGVDVGVAVAVGVGVGVAVGVGVGGGGVGVGVVVVELAWQLRGLESEWGLQLVSQSELDSVLAYRNSRCPS